MSGSPGTGGAIPGLLSPFDLSSAASSLGQTIPSMANRYKQLGLGQIGATPTDPGSFGTGSTAMQMDIGALPSLTGGIPAEVEAGLGQVQTQDLAQSLALAHSNLAQGTSNKGGLLGGIDSLITGGSK